MKAFLEAEAACDRGWTKPRARAGYDGVPGKVASTAGRRSRLPSAGDLIKPYVAKWIAETPQTISLVQSNEIDFLEFPAYSKVARRVFPSPMSTRPTSLRRVIPEALKEPAPWSPRTQRPAISRILTDRRLFVQHPGIQPGEARR